MKPVKLFLLLFFLLFLLAVFLKPAFAIVDPLLTENNRVGIHILDPNEVDKVVDLVNGDNGEWGYVTVPIRDDDRDRFKWQRFMDKCREFKLIPIIRIATVMKPGGWESPTLLQSLDFANFLNGLDWPARNRYIIVYNEPNHASEWDGYVDPFSYAKILKYTSQIFKIRNEDFFILPGGLDAAAPDGKNHLSIYNFINQMIASEPDVFDYIDGWASHAYPNPAFSGSPADVHSHSIVSYRHEIAYLKNFTDKDFPIFITETGWKDNIIGEDKSALYYKVAFERVWNEDNIVAVTPFLFQAGSGPFTPFSFIRQNGEQKLAYAAVKDISKVKGKPELSANSELGKILGMKEHSENNTNDDSYQPKFFLLSSEKWHKILRWFMIY